jgi:hypothetical protein
MILKVETNLTTRPGILADIRADNKISYLFIIWLYGVLTAASKVIIFKNRANRLKKL